MRHFELMDLVFRLAPFPTWKAGLLRGHIDKCPECERRLASREEVRRVLAQVRDVGDLDRLWPAVAGRIRGIRPSLEPNTRPARAGVLSLRAAWRWTAAAAGLALAAVTLLALIRFLQSPPVSQVIAKNGSDQVQIHYVRIDNEPARTFIFKPHDSDVVIVWAGKNI